MLEKKLVIIDGSVGTVNQLKRQLTRNNLLNEKKTKGIVTIYSSSIDSNMIDLSYKLLNHKYIFMILYVKINYI